MPKKIKYRHVPPSVPFRAADYLRNEDEMVAYVEEMLIDGDDRVLPIALRTLREPYQRSIASVRAVDASGHQLLLLVPPYFFADVDGRGAVIDSYDNEWHAGQLSRPARIVAPPTIGRHKAMHRSAVETASACHDDRQRIWSN